jgi:nucleotide-binding universal stress UspA family protein
VTIVVGYVPKPEGRAALQRAVAEASLRRENLLVINASRGDAYADARFAPEEDLAAVRAELAETGVPFEVRQLVRGADPADEVLGAAAEAKAPLIVIGLRRRTPVGKLIMGSTSQRILLEADCPVLAVKADRAGS